MEDGIATWKDKRGNDRADRAADEGVKNHSDEICKISKIQAQRQYGYIVFIKNIHDHILEAFYKKEYIESVILNENEKEGQQKVANQTIKHIQIGEISYNQDLLKPSTRDITSVGNMGETMCKYKNAFKVHNLFETCPFTATKEGEDGV